MSNTGKVSGVLAGALLGHSREIRLLITQIDFGPGDAPVAVTTRPALLMELEIVGIAGITMLAAPHLDSGARIAGEKPYLRSAGVGSVSIIRAVEIFRR